MKQAQAFSGVLENSKKRNLTRQEFDTTTILGKDQD
jgi:hypothetical protein